MTIRVYDLEPGDVLTDPLLGQATFIGRLDPHPLHPSLSLVVWWVHRDEKFSFDALYSQQELPGSIVPHTFEQRKTNLRNVLQPGARS